MTKDTKALAKKNAAIAKRKHHHITTEQIMMIAAAAGIVSALLPSVPTIVRFWGDETEINFLGQRMKYSTFLRGWLIASIVGLGLLWWRFRRK